MSCKPVAHGTALNAICGSDAPAHTVSVLQWMHVQGCILAQLVRTFSIREMLPDRAA